MIKITPNRITSSSKLLRLITITRFFLLFSPRRAPFVLKTHYYHTLLTKKIRREQKSRDGIVNSVSTKNTGDGICLPLTKCKNYKKSNFFKNTRRARADSPKIIDQKQILEISNFSPRVASYILLFSLHLARSADFR